MANVSGTGSGWAFIKEVSYGTALATTKAMPLIDESLELNPNFVDLQTLKGGNYVRTDASWRIGYFKGAGSIQTQLFTNGTAALFEAMLGANNTTGAGPFVHTATLAKNLPSYSMQFTYGGSTGVPRKAVEGVMVDSWEIAVAVGEAATLGLEVVYEAETITTSATLQGSYPTPQLPYAALDFGTLTLAGAEYCVQSLRVAGANNLNSDIVCIGDNFIQRPVRTGAFADITGEVEILLDDTTLTTLYDLFKAGTPIDIVMLATQGTNTLGINLRARIDGHPITVDSPDLLTVVMPFTITTDGTDADGINLVTTNGDATP